MGVRGDRKNNDITDIFLRWRTELVSDETCRAQADRTPSFPCRWLGHEASPSVEGFRPFAHVSASDRDLEPLEVPKVYEQHTFFFLPMRTN